VTGVPSDISNVIDVKWQDGSPATPGQLGSDGAFVSKDYAKSHTFRSALLSTSRPRRGKRCI